MKFKRYLVQPNYIWMPNKLHDTYFPLNLQQHTNGKSWTISSLLYASLVSPGLLS